MEEIHDFIGKNKAGEKLEKEVIEDIRKKRYPTTHKYEPNNGDYDVFIDEINEGIEIKNDLEALFSNNICIEYKQDGRLSGISITKAKYWIQYDQTYLYLALTEDIKYLIRSFLIYHIDLKKFATGLALADYPSDVCTTKLKEFETKSREKYGDLYEEIQPTDRIGDLPNKKLNHGNYYKYMGLYLVPKELFRKYCLEVNPINKMTYKGLQ